MAHYSCRPINVSHQRPILVRTVYPKLSIHNCLARFTFRHGKVSSSPFPSLNKLNSPSPAAIRAPSNFLHINHGADHYRNLGEMAKLHASHSLGHPLKMVETVLEVADVAWNAYEHHRHRHEKLVDGDSEGDQDLCRFREENRRLRNLLADNLEILQGISEFPSFTKDCPPDVTFSPLKDYSNFSIHGLHHF